MKITLSEVITRDCCDPAKDLVKVIKTPFENSLYWFCKYCGRHWHERYTENAKFGFEGNPMIRTFERVLFPWEK